MRGLTSESLAHSESNPRSSIARAKSTSRRRSEPAHGSAASGGITPRRSSASIPRSCAPVRQRGNSLQGMAINLPPELTGAMSAISVTMSSEFGTVLRQWRTRRRLSQLELAIGAGTTQRHVSFLEQGRSTPGRDIVTRLAESLDLTLREHNALLSTAGFAPLHPESAP